MSVIPELRPEAPATSHGSGVNSQDEVIEVISEAVPNTQAEAGRSSHDTSFSEGELPSESFMVTIVSIKQSGTFLAKVLDSRYDSIDEAWAELERSEASEETIYRLVLAEDLPKKTEDLLEKVLGGDRKVLTDHAANKSLGSHGRNARRVRQPHAHLHVNLSEPPATISIAIPYDIIASTEKPTRLDVHKAMAFKWDMEDAMYWMENRPCALYTSWLTVAHTYLNIPHLFLHVAYRRTSVRYIPAKAQVPPVCVILLYPPLASPETKHFDSQLSTDLAYPSNYAAENTTKSSLISNIGITKVPLVTGKLVHFFAAQLENCGPASRNVPTIISTWMTSNAVNAFRNSIHTSITHFCYFSEMFQQRPLFNEVVDIPKPHYDFLDRFREAITVKVRHLEKARIELSQIEDLDSNTEIQVRIGWQRLGLSLASLLADVDTLLQKRNTVFQRRMTEIQIEESRTAIQQAETVKRLTRLAFVFIPLSATCSAFGMNIQELLQKPPPVWVSLVVMLGVTIATVVCSMEITHNVFWGIDKILEPLHSDEITKTLANPIQLWISITKAFAHDINGKVAPRLLPRISDATTCHLEKYPQPVRLIFKTARLLYYLSMVPLILVHRLAWTGVMQKRARQDRRRYGYVKDKDVLKWLCK